MNCSECDGKMTVAREKVKYDVSGLSGVTFRNVEVRRCSNCGEYEVVIPKIEELHRLIALTIIRKPSALAPEEIRFLRKYLGWSGVDFANHMGAKPETMSRWENGKLGMSGQADRLLRANTATRIVIVLIGSPLRDRNLVCRAKVYPITNGGRSAHYINGSSSPRSARSRSTAKLRTASNAFPCLA